MRVPKERVLNVALLSMSVVHIGHPEPGGESISPLEVVHQFPGKVAPEIHTVRDSLERISDVPLVEVDAEGVVEGLLDR